MRLDAPLARVALVASAALLLAAAPGRASDPICVAPPFETEPNATPATADILGSPCWSFRGAVNPANDVDVFRLVGVNGMRLWALVDTGEPPNQDHDTDSTLELLAADGTTLIESDDDDGIGNGGDSTLETNLASAILGRSFGATGNFYLRVREFDGTDLIDNYMLVLITTFIDRDRPESEPNGTFGTANSAAISPQVFKAAVAPDGEVDFYRFHARAGELIFLAVDGNPERDGSNTDVDVELRGTDGGATLLFAATDLNSGDGAGGVAFRFVVPDTGDYFVRVFGHGAATGTYDLMIAGASELFRDGFASGNHDKWSSHVP